MSDKKELPLKQKRFIKFLSKGLGKAESARRAGYSEISASSQANKLLKKVQIQAALEKVGLTSEVLASGIRVNMQAGMGVKATADTSLRAIELALRLRGDLDRELPDKGNTTNVYVNELRNLDITELTQQYSQLNINP